jgi:hypothetical protein
MYQKKIFDEHFKLFDQQFVKFKYSIYLCAYKLIRYGK